MGQTSLCEPTANFFNLFLTDSSKDVKTTNRSSDVNFTETTKNSVDSMYIVQHFNMSFFFVRHTLSEMENFKFQLYVAY